MYFGSVFRGIFRGVFRDVIRDVFGSKLEFAPRDLQAFHYWEVPRPSTYYVKYSVQILCDS